MWIRTPRRQGRRLPTSSLYRIGARGGLPPSGPAPGRTVSAAAKGTSPAAPCACCTSRPSGAARGPGAHQPRRSCEVQAAPGRGVRPRGQAPPGCSRPGAGGPVVRTLGRAGRSCRERRSRLPRRMDDPKGREERKSGPFPGTLITPLPSRVSGCPVMRAGGRQGRARGRGARALGTRRPESPLAPGSPSARPFSPQPREAAPRTGSRVPRAGHFPVRQT